MPAAARLLRRAAGTLQDGHPGRPGLLLQAGEALFESGDFEAAQGTIRSAAEAADATGERGIAAASEVERLRMEYLTGALTDAGEVETAVRALLPDLSAANSHAGLARAWRLLASIDLAACRWGEAEQAAWQMIEHARAAGDRTMELRVLPVLTLFLQKGPTPVGEAIEECRQILDRVATDRRSAAMATRQLAQLHAMRGEFGEARSLYRESRRTLEELGWAFDAAIVSLDSGPIELLAGDPAAAETELQRDYSALQAMGDRNFVALTAALLAEARYRRGRFAEAAEAVASAEEVAAPDDLGAQVLWRTVKAKLTAREGDAETAGALVAEALRLIESTEDPSGQAEALVDASEVARLAGEPRRAAGLLRRALGKHLEKGNLAGAHRVEGLLADAI
jgi:tetratricopeptide (TPR) repeat protein